MSDEGVTKTTNSIAKSIPAISNNKQAKAPEPYRLQTMRFDRDLSSPTMVISNSSKFLVNAITDLTVKST